MNFKKAQTFYIQLSIAKIFSSNFWFRTSVSMLKKMDLLHFCHKESLLPKVLGKPLEHLLACQYRILHSTVHNFPYREMLGKVFSSFLLLYQKTKLNTKWAIFGNWKYWSRHIEEETKGGKNWIGNCPNGLWRIKAVEYSCSKAYSKYLPLHYHLWKHSQDGSDPQTLGLLFSQPKLHYFLLHNTSPKPLQQRESSAQVIQLSCSLLTAAQGQYCSAYSNGAIVERDGK